MKLNCRPGDLSVIVSCPNSPSAVGRFVTVIRPSVDGERISGFFVFKGIGGGPGWIVAASSPIEWCGDFVMERAIFDNLLKPIRNEPGDDESLSWCDVPSGVTA